LRTRKPTLRITKWLRRIQTTGQRIPIEAECTACADAQFKVKYDKRMEYGGFHQPNGDRNLSGLQGEFEKHLKLVYPDEFPSKSQK
jgi:hypothetical protein